MNTFTEEYRDILKFRNSYYVPTTVTSHPLRLVVGGDYEGVFNLRVSVCTLCSPAKN